MYLLLLPIAIVLLIPACVGFLRMTVHVYHLLSQRTDKKRAFTATVLLCGVMLCLLTAPHMFGVKGWLVVSALYLFMLWLGAGHTWRIMQFIKRELDDDPTNDVPLDDKPKGGPATTDQVTSDKKD